MIGETIGNYRLVRQLGSGGMGAVFEAVDVMLERPVAVKMLRPEIASQPGLTDRFRVEAITLARLNHPSIATLYAFLREGERYAMVMEYVRGRTLEALLAKTGRLQPAMAASLMRQTLEGVAHAHAFGVMHRDIKPANIMVTAEAQVKVTDFGIARILGASRMTREGRIIGTLEYIAPERIRGEEEDFRSDLYSAGVVLYEMLAGRLPFVSDTDFGLMQAHLQQPPPELSQLGIDCPASLQEILHRALAKAPAERFQSAQDFRDALATADIPAPVMAPTRLATPVSPYTTAPVSASHARPLMETRLASSTPAPTPPPLALPPPVPRKRNDLLVIGGAVAFCVLGLVSIMLLRSRPVVPEVPQPAPTAVATNQPAAQPPQQQVQLPLSPQTELPAPITLQQPPPTNPAATPVEQPRTQSPAPTPRKPEETARKPAEPPRTETPTVPPPAPAPAPPVQVAPTPAADVRAEHAEATPARPPRPRTLRAVRRLYIEKMKDELDVHIRDEIRKQVPALNLVARRTDADAIMRGAGEKDDDTASKVTGGYLGLKSAYKGAVTITDIDGANLLWSGEAGDARALVGVIKRGGPKKVAERLVSDLRKALNR